MALLLCNDVQPGMTLAADVKDRLGRILIARGICLTDAHLRALKIRGVHTIDVLLPASEEPAREERISSETLGKLHKEVDALFRLNRMHKSHPFIKTMSKQCLLRLTHMTQAAAENNNQNDAAILRLPFTLLEHQEVKSADASDQITVEYLVQRTQTVASLPAVYHQLLEVVNDERSSAQDIARVISTDSGLTARLLRLVNSPFYGFPGKIDTVSRAVAIVGVNELCQLALATTVMHAFSRALVGKIDVQLFWRHSLLCASLCRILALRRREPNPEHFFVIGLLHDIGRLVLFTHIPHRAIAIIQQTAAMDEADFRNEVAELSFDHAELGKALLTAWGVPESLYEAVGNHHHPMRSMACPMETAALHVANIIANAMDATRPSSSGEVRLPVSPLIPAAWDMLALPTDILAEAMQEASLQMNELCAVFELEAV